MHTALAPTLTANDQLAQRYYDSAANSYHDFGQFGRFSLQFFLTRYLVGGSALRQGRKVSRRRLALITSGIGAYDPEAVQLAEQIIKYHAGRAELTTKGPMTLAKICKANLHFTDGKHQCGKLRSKQNWIGAKTIEKATYVPPATDLVPSLLANWLADYNNNSINDNWAKAVTAYVTLLRIHPFNDGNGRTARALFDVTLSAADKSLVHHSIFRLGHEQQPYLDAMMDFAIDSQQQSSSPYWQSANQWGEQFNTAALQLLSQCKNQIMAKFGLMILSKQDRQLIDYLWHQPVVCEAGLQQHFGWDFKTIRLCLSKLVSAKVLQRQSLRLVQNAQVYACNAIFECWDALDKRVNEGKEVN